jgi:hypothetical protein
MLSTWHNNQQVDGGHYEAPIEALDAFQNIFFFTLQDTLKKYM